MSRFQIRKIRIDNFRCFGAVRLPLEEDTTVIFAENGGGKTALLTALAIGLAAFQRGSPKSPRLDARRDTRVRILDGKGRREPVGPCTLAWTTAVGESDYVMWSMKADPASGRTTTHCQPILDALERIRVPGSRWPLFAWYDVGRLARSRDQRGKVKRTLDRWEAYGSALDPDLDEDPLLQWLQDEPERSFHAAVMDATVHATPGVTNAWYDPAQGPVVRFENGYVAPWSELSDGYQAFNALVADIARRAVMLNEFDGAAAPERVEGVVLIDAPQAHLRRLGGDHADAPWADWGPARRRHSAGVRDFRALLAQERTPTYPFRPRVRGLREPPTFRTPCRASRGRRADLLRACCCASQRVP